MLKGKQSHLTAQKQQPQWQLLVFVTVQVWTKKESKPEIKHCPEISQIGAKLNSQA